MKKLFLLLILLLTSSALNAQETDELSAFKNFFLNHCKEQVEERFSYYPIPPEPIQTYCTCHLDKIIENFSTQELIHIGYNNDLIKLISLEKETKELSDSCAADMITPTRYRIKK